MAAGAIPGAGPPSGNPEDEIANAVGAVIGGVIGLCWGGIILTGALKLKRLESYGYAMTAAIVAMVPCSGCCILGLPFGIWGLIVLGRPEVQDQFS